MEYTTNDLSKILDVSTNTIRRYEEKGFINSVRNEKNGYRQFDHVDVEKLMYTNKYRKAGFSQDNIAEMFRGDIPHKLRCFQDKMAEIDAQIAHLTAVRHMLKDDIGLMHRIEQYGPEMIEMDCSPMHYVLYQIGGTINMGKEQEEALHRFMSSCPEFEYIYFFAKEDAEAGRLVYSEGVAANQLVTKKYQVQVDPPVRVYERHPGILKFVRLPLDFRNEEMISREELQWTLFGQFFDYMKQHDMVLAGDVVGVKIGMSREKGQDWQYVLMHFPVEGLH